MKSKELGRLRRIAEQLVKLQQELNEASESDRVNYRARPPNVRSSRVAEPAFTSGATERGKPAETWR